MIKDCDVLDSPILSGGESTGRGSSPAVILPPWAEPYRLISLWEIMERFDPKLLLAASSTLEVWATTEIEDPLDSEASIKLTSKSLGMLRSQCYELGLKVTAKAIERTITLLSKPSPSRREFKGLCSDILSRLRDELDSVHLIALSSKEATYYEDWFEGWMDIIRSFPSTVDDIEEASKSLACSRATACVYHLMRIMEHGLKELSNAIGISYAPSWESHLKQIQANLDKAWKDKEPEWKKQESFYREVLGLLQGVKVAWRNPTMHIVNHYTPEQAEDIFGAVRGFMRHLATNLKEDRSKKEPGGVPPGNTE